MMRTRTLVLLLLASASLAACTGQRHVAAASSVLMPAPIALIPKAVVGAAIVGLPGAVWADADNDGVADGYVRGGEYHRGPPEAYDPTLGRVVRVVAVAPAPPPAVQPAPQPPRATAPAETTPDPVSARRAGERG